MPQAPAPGPAPFQQSNVGLASAAQGGGPSPVAALVAATQKPPNRVNRPAPQAAPRADFSGILVGGSSIGNAMRVKYQREFDEKMADKAHANVLKQQTHMSKLQEDVLNRSTVATTKIRLTESQISQESNELQNEATAYAIARQRRGTGSAEGEVMPKGLEAYNSFFTMSDDLFNEGYDLNRWKTARRSEEVADMHQVMFDEFATALGMDPGEPIIRMEEREAAADADGPLAPHVARLERSDVIHGPAGEGLTPLQRGSADMMAELGTHAFVSDYLSVEEQLFKKDRKELGNQQARMASAERLIQRNIGIKKALDLKEAKTQNYLMGFGVPFKPGVKPDELGKANDAAVRKHMMSESKQLVLSHLTRDTMWGRDNAVGTLKQTDTVDMIKGLFPGEQSQMMARFIDVVMSSPSGQDHATFKRMADAMQPGGDSSLGQWSPALMASANFMFTQLVNSLESMEPGTPTPEGVELSEAKIANWATAYNLDDLEPHEARLLGNLTHDVKDIAERLQKASNHAGNMNHSIEMRSAALWLHRTEHALQVNEETQGNLVDDMIDAFNNGPYSMPAYIDADIDTFDRVAGEYFRVLGGVPLPEGVQGPPAPQQALDQLPPNSAAPQPQQQQQPFPPNQQAPQTVPPKIRPTDYLPAGAQ